jgi:hypothetical protein
LEQRLKATISSTTSALAPVLQLPKAGRAAIFGMTGAGKTLLADTLRESWLTTYQTGKVLIVDSKPHYRAQWQLSGIAAAPLYRKWEQNTHDFVPGSYVLPLGGSYEDKLKLAFRKTRVVIVQGGRQHWQELLAATAAFYQCFGAKAGPRLIDVDEAADFFEVDRFGGILLQALRAGRQLGLGVLFGSQRPKFIPKSTLTESDRIYLMKMKSADDFTTLVKDGGWPRQIAAPQDYYDFRYWDFTNEAYPSGGLFRLAEEGEAHA